MILSKQTKILNNKMANDSDANQSAFCHKAIK